MAKEMGESEHIFIPDSSASLPVHCAVDVVCCPP